MPQALAAAASNTGRVLTQALVETADRLSVGPSELKAIIGVSQPTASRLLHGAYELTPGSKPFELAAHLVRLYRSLSAMVGGDDALAGRWLRSANLAFRKRPADRGHQARRRPAACLRIPGRPPRSRLRRGRWAGSGWRAVEAQHRVATLRLARGNLDDQRLLEDILDAAKPPAASAADDLHWLLATPFRYRPPLGGSRFRARTRSWRVLRRAGQAHRLRRSRLLATAVFSGQRRSGRRIGDGVSSRCSSSTPPPTARST